MSIVAKIAKKIYKAGCMAGNSKIAKKIYKAGCMTSSCYAKIKIMEKFGFTFEEQALFKSVYKPCVAYYGIKFKKIISSIFTKARRVNNPI